MDTGYLYPWCLLSRLETVYLFRAKYDPKGATVASDRGGVLVSQLRPARRRSQVVGSTLDGAGFPSKGHIQMQQIKFSSSILD